MRLKSAIIILLSLLLIIPYTKAQVTDQAKLFRLLPAIPSDLTTATDDEVLSFIRKCDSISGILSVLEEKYKRSNDADETNSDKIFEYFAIRDSILDLHSTERQKYYDLVTTFSDLEYETSVKNSSVEESIDNLKQSGDKQELNSLYKQIYDNRVECSGKQVAIYLQFLNEYRAKLDNIAWKANKSEDLALPDHLNKNVSYVLLNVRKYLDYLSEVYKFNVGPFTIPE